MFDFLNQPFFITGFHFITFQGRSFRRTFNNFERTSRTVALLQVTTLYQVPYMQGNSSDRSVVKCVHNFAVARAIAVLGNKSSDKIQQFLLLFCRPCDLTLRHAFSLGIFLGKPKTCTIDNSKP